MKPILSFGLKLATLLKHALMALCLLLMTLWLGLALWVQQPLASPWTQALMVAWLGLAVGTMLTLFKKFRPWRKTVLWTYLTVFALGLGWFFSLPAKQDRAWAPEVAK